MAINHAREYYQRVFSQLYDETKSEIFSVSAESAKKRFDQFVKCNVKNDPHTYESLEPEIQSFVDELSVELQQILEKHSHFYWKHLFRRIGVNISSGYHKSGSLATNKLVRDIVELGVDKYAPSELGHDICGSLDCCLLYTSPSPRDRG